MKTEDNNSDKKETGTGLLVEKALLAPKQAIIRSDFYQTIVMDNNINLYYFINS